MHNIYASQYATIKRLADEGKLGKVQTVSVTVNGNPESAERDLAALLSFIEAKPTYIRYVVSQKPYPHGSIVLNFENAVLARYVFTAASAAERTDWHVYSDKTELYARAEEGQAQIIPADLFPNVETVDFIASDQIPQYALPAEALAFCHELCRK